MGVIAIPDYSNNSKDVATKIISAVHYQNVDPPVTTFHYVNDGTDSVNVVASPAYLRAVRIFNNDAAMIKVALHNTAGTPTAGASVVWAEAVQAGSHNPEPKLASGGRFFSAGIGMSIVTGLADSDATAVTAGVVLVEIEYEQYT